MMIDPFDVDGRDDVLDYLADEKRITNPAGSFGMRISEKSKSAMNEQL